MTEQKRKAVIGILLIAVTLAVYARSLQCEFVIFDDPVYVTENGYVKLGFTYQSVIWAFTTNHDGNWFPLTWLSHLLDVELFGLAPGPHHAVSVLIHAINTLLLFLFLSGATGKLYRSAVVAALFALHPLHVESVAWVSERKDVLSTFFWLLTLLAYTVYARRNDRGKLRLAILFCALGLMSKPMLVSTPFLLLILDFWPLQRFQLTRPALGKLFVEKVPFLLLALASSIVTLTVQGSVSIVPIEHLSIGARAANAVVSYGWYVLKTILPLRLASFYPHPGPSLFVPLILLSSVLLAAITAVAMRLARRLPFFTTGWLWFIVTLIPVIGLVQVGKHGMADRYAYLTNTGLFIAGVWGTAEILKRIRFGKFISWALAALILTIFGIGTAKQILYWTNSITLYERALDVTEDNWFMKCGLGVAYLADGNTAAAEKVFSGLITISSDLTSPTGNMALTVAKARSHRYLGDIRFASKDYSEARRHFESAIELWPRYSEAVTNLGAVLARDGDTHQAEQRFLQAIQIDPNDATAHFNLGSILKAGGYTGEAIDHFQTAIRVQPDHARAYYLLGAIMREQSLLDEAEEHLKRSIRFNEKQSDANYQLGLVYAQRGKLESAIPRFEAAIKIDPSFAAAHVDRGVALALHGRFEEAEESLRQAIDLDSGNVNAYKNYGLTLARLDRLADAIASYQRALEIDSKQAQVANNLAWILAAGRDPALRNGPEALFYAELACRESDYKQPEAVATLAAAYAEVGNFKKAEQSVRQAIDLAKAMRKNILVNQYEYRLGLYQTGRAYYEE